jgi:hypothetical protein
MSLEWTNALVYLNTLGTISLAANLAWNRLYRVYPFFFAYLLADAAEELTLLVLPNPGNAYSWTYVFGQSLKIVLAVFVVLELYQIALAQRPALARFGRNTVGYILAAAGAVSICFLMLDRTIPAGRSRILHRLNSFERTMDLWMLVFIIIISVFMAWFPVRVTRNGALFIGGFAVYFLSRAIGLLLSNIVPRFLDRFDVAMLSVSFVCLLMWLLALRHQGEQVTMMTSPRRDPGTIRHLTEQLDAINSRLTELSRR